MSEKNKHIEHLTPELIKAYRNGELTREQQHEVELLMLENPLYEDGLEGLEQVTDQMLDIDLAELDSRLDSLLSKEEQKTGFWTIWRGIAAGLVIVLIATSLFYLNQDKPIPNKLLTENKTKKTDSLGEARQAQPSADDSVSSPTEPQKTDTSLIEIDFDEADMVEELVAEEETELAIPKIDLDLKELTVESLAQFKVDSVNLVIPMNNMDEQMAKVIAEAEAVDVLRARAAGVRIQAESQMSQALAAPSPTKAEASLVTIKGKVTDADDGLPLPGVNVIQSGSNNASITNGNGQFVINNIAIGDSLSFSFIGYVTRTISITDVDSLNIGLEPDATALGEVVVVGYGTADKKELTLSVSRAQPVNGYPEFNEYLKDNLNYPETARTENIRGRVTVEFTVK
ncbi:MAG: carboxypeptidase-like regulatory domain-containing protein, partial [Cytophagia bacterium]|nr:carboxypeptidase-like regulatory domain-containing protein [Cytophagia bacterium]